MPCGGRKRLSVHRYRAVIFYSFFFLWDCLVQTSESILPLMPALGAWWMLLCPVSLMIRPNQTKSTVFKIEPTHEIMALIALRKLNRQTRMRSNPLGLHVWFLVRPFVYVHTLCVRTAKALARLCGCAVSPEPSLIAYAISTIISWAGSFVDSLYFWRIPFSEKLARVKCAYLKRPTVTFVHNKFSNFIIIVICPTERRNIAQIKR